jgi:hypothetical protein
LIFWELSLVFRKPPLDANTGKSSTRDTGRRKTKEDGREWSIIDLLVEGGWGGGVQFNGIKQMWYYFTILGPWPVFFQKIVLIKNI